MIINQETKKELVLIQDLGMLFPKETSKEKKRYGLYRCYCGNEFKSMIQSVKSGNATSCGCFCSEQTTTHGLIKHRLYQVWNAMMQRCNNKNNPSYENYGGRGITVCNRWQYIKNFIDDMYPTYKEGLTIDRIDVNGNYEPDNCRWTTNDIQHRNTRILKSTNKSGYRGVSKKGNSFVAQICVDSKRIYLGTFENDLDAAKAYDKYVIDNNLEHTINGVL